MARDEAVEIGRDGAHILDVVHEEHIAVLEDQVGRGSLRIVPGQRPPLHAEQLDGETQRVVLLVWCVRWRVTRPSGPSDIGTGRPNPDAESGRTPLRDRQFGLGDAMLFAEDSALCRLLAVLDAHQLELVDKQIARFLDGLDATVWRQFRRHGRPGSSASGASNGILQRSHLPLPRPTILAI